MKCCKSKRCQKKISPQGTQRGVTHIKACRNFGMTDATTVNLSFIYLAEKILHIRSLQPGGPSEAAVLLRNPPGNYLFEI